jgi:hypothetical protein
MRLGLKRKTYGITIEVTAAVSNDESHVSQELLDDVPLLLSGFEGSEANITGRANTLEALGSSGHVQLDTLHCFYGITREEIKFSSVLVRERLSNVPAVGFEGEIVLLGNVVDEVNQPGVDFEDNDALGESGEGRSDTKAIEVTNHQQLLVQEVSKLVEETYTDDGVSVGHGSLIIVLIGWGAFLDDLLELLEHLLRERSDSITSALAVIALAVVLLVRSDLLAYHLLTCFSEGYLIVSR